MLKTKNRPTKRRAANPRSDVTVLAHGSPAQDRKNKAALEMIDLRLKKIAEMTDAQRKAAAIDYKEYEAMLRANALSPRNR
jgi:hypothetical protein